MCLEMDSHVNKEETYAFYSKEFVQCHNIWSLCQFWKKYILSYFCPLHLTYELLFIDRSYRSFIDAFLVNWVCLIEQREYLGLPELSIKHIFFVSVEQVLQKFTPADSAQEFQNGRKRWAIVNLICSIFNFVGY